MTLQVQHRRGKAQLSWTPCQGGVVLNSVNDEKHWKMLHERYAVGVMHRGTAEWRYRYRYMEIGPGGVFICEPGEIHTIVRHSGSADFTVFFVNEDTIRSVGEAMGVGPTPHFAAQGVWCSELWQRFAGLRTVLHPQSRKELSESFNGALADLMMETSDRKPDPQGVSSEGLNRVYQDLCGRFRGEPKRAVSIRAVALEHKIPYHSLVRAFRREYGMAPYEMVMALRANRAFQLLRRGPSRACRSLSALAQSCGYSDGAHLTRGFQRYWGTTPSEAARSLNPEWINRQPRPWTQSSSLDSLDSLLPA